MVKTKLILFGLLCLCVCSCAQIYKWESVSMNGSRTGCVATTTDNVVEALGVIEADGTYKSPSGNVYPAESTTAKIASAVIAAQPKMSSVKKVIAHSEESMHNTGRESRLSNWFVDLLMEETEKLSGKKVDIGITNFGGIRVDMPQGDVLLDDMLSMFPFKNYLTYIEYTGRQVRKILETMAAGRFQVLGGVRVVADGGKLLTAEIGGEPIDDDKIYGVATINFLLEGGDGLTLAENGLSVTVYEDIPIITAVLAHIKADTEAGRPIEYKTDGRVVVKDYKKRR